MDAGSSQVPPSPGGHDQTHITKDRPVVTRSSGSALT